MPDPVASPGVVERGQLMYGPRQVSVAYTQESLPIADANAAIGDPFTEITPTNRQNSEKKVYAIPDLSGFFLKYTGYSNIDLPNVLTSLSIDFVKGGSDSGYTEIATAGATGLFSIGVSVSGTAQASAFCVPKPLYAIDTPATTNVPVINCFFYTTDLSTANILSILTAQLGATVLAWPVFKAKPLTLTLTGMKASATARADYQASASVGSSGSSASQSDGLGKGFDLTPSVEQVQLPPTIHGSFSLTGSDTQTNGAATSVVVSGGIISGGGSGSAGATATGTVTPTSISATSPAALPSSGLYLYKVNPETSPIFNNYFVQAIVFDFSTL